MPVPRPWPPGSPGGPPLGSASTPRSRGWHVGEKPSLELWPSRGVTTADPRAGHRRGAVETGPAVGARSFHVKPSSAGGQPAHGRLGWALRGGPCPPLVPQTEASVTAGPLCLLEKAVFAHHSACVHGPPCDPVGTCQWPRRRGLSPAPATASTGQSLRGPVFRQQPP